MPQKHGGWRRVGLKVLCKTCQTSRLNPSLEGLEEFNMHVDTHVLALESAKYKLKFEELVSEHLTSKLHEQI